MINNLKISKGVIIPLMSLSLVSATLTGCSKNLNSNLRNKEMTNEQNSYDLKNNGNFVIIETIDSAGNKDIHFAEKVQLSKLENPSTNVNKYSDYLDLNKSFPTNTYLYLDLDKDVLTVHYTDPNIYNRDDIEKDSYIIKKIISEEAAYLKAKEFYGDKKIYYKDEIELMMINLKENYKGKQKIK